MRLLIALLVLLAAAPAQAATEVSPGRGETSGMIGGCDVYPCAYVQERWDAVHGEPGPGSLPFTAEGRITRLRMRLHVGGEVRLRVIRRREHSSTDGVDYDVVASSPAIAVASESPLDTSVDLPVRTGDRLAVSLDDGARPYLIYEQGSGGPGGGDLLYAPGDGDSAVTGAKLLGGGSADMDGVSFIATLEVGATSTPPADPPPSDPAPSDPAPSDPEPLEPAPSATAKIRLSGAAGVAPRGVYRLGIEGLAPGSRLSAIVLRVRGCCRRVLVPRGFADAAGAARVRFRMPRAFRPGARVTVRLRGGGATLRVRVRSQPRR